MTQLLVPVLQTPRQCLVVAHAEQRRRFRDLPFALLQRKRDQTRFVSFGAMLERAPFPGLGEIQPRLVSERHDFDGAGLDDAFVSGLTHTHLNTDISVAMSSGRPLLDYSKSSGYLDYRRLAEEVVNVTEGKSAEINAGAAPRRRSANDDKRFAEFVQPPPVLDHIL